MDHDTKEVEHNKLCDDEMDLRSMASRLQDQKNPYTWKHYQKYAKENEEY